MFNDVAVPNVFIAMRGINGLWPRTRMGVTQRSGYGAYAVWDLDLSRNNGFNGLLLGYKRRHSGATRARSGSEQFA
jgi:hypothetical protein